MVQPAIPKSIAIQVSKVCGIIERYLKTSLKAIHLFGSSVDSGLKPQSDIDLLITVSEKLEDSTRNRLMLELLDYSAPPGLNKALRALEVTVICHSEISPWRYPAIREMQFGEWLREDILNGVIESATVDIDLTLLLKKVREHSITIIGCPAETLFDEIPDKDFIKTLRDTLKIWNAPIDWIGDEQNVILTLSRIWYSAATGRITSKEDAANWLIPLLPDCRRSVLFEAQQAYLRGRPHTLATYPTEVASFIQFAQSNIPL